MGKAVSISVSDLQRSILERWRKNKVGTSAQLVERCSIILLSADGLTNAEQARMLGVDRQRVRRWRTRWSKNEARLKAAEMEGASERDLSNMLRELLADEQRPGVPPTFTAEQLTQIIAVACEPPSDSGRPVTHWTPKELAAEVIQRGIVETISPRHVGRILKKGLSARTSHDTG